MTFNFSPWAIDGARSTSALARLANYAGGGGRSGIVQPTDLKVLPLSVPGNGLRITAGGGVILNRYQTVPNQSYIVSNPSQHEVLAVDMPAPQATTSSYLVCVVVGDPEFDNSGHPFMPSTPLAPEVAADFEYVRVVLVPCPPDTARFDHLGLNYPGMALARVEIPANTSTITAEMITDIRDIAQPRTERKPLVTVAPNDFVLINESMSDWIPWFPTVEVPEWATEMHVIMTLTGVLSSGTTSGALRTRVGSMVGSELPYDVDSAGTERRSFTLVSGHYVDHLQGQTVQLALQGRRNAAESGFLTTGTGGGTQVIFDVQFDQKPR